MKRFIFLSILILFASFLFGADDPKFTNHSYARLSFVTGSTYIQRASDVGYEEGVLNMPIEAGDRIGTTDGRAEIYLGKNNYIRLDNDSKIDFLSLPNKESDLTQIRLWSGSAYFSIGLIEKEKTFEIHTADVSVYFLDKGVYRIDVKENAETTILVFTGLVEAAGESGSVLIKDSQKLESVEGRFTTKPSKFFAVAEDSFDKWSVHRDSELRQEMAKRYLPEELEDYEYELSRYGSWVYVPPYGYVWVPGSTFQGWRPYYNGRWIWLSSCGWTWLPYDPWGWVTFHYGRWHWNTGLGWYWIPTTVWGPAWVSWYWGHDYWGWVPLSYYGYPGMIINNIYYGRYYGRHYPYYSPALTVIRKDQLKARNVSSVALSQESIKSLGKLSLTDKAPAIKPSHQISIDQIKGTKKVMLRNNPESWKGNERGTIRNLNTPTKSRSLETIRKNYLNQDRTLPKERNILKRKMGYPSSPDITLRKYKSRSSMYKSNNSSGRIYDYIFKSSRSRSSSSSPKTMSRPSKSRISSPPSSSRASRPQHSGSSRSGKVKKK